MWAHEEGQDILQSYVVDSQEYARRDRQGLRNEARNGKLELVGQKPQTML